MLPGLIEVLTVPVVLLSYMKPNLGDGHTFVVLIVYVATPSVILEQVHLPAIPPPGSPERPSG